MCELTGGRICISLHHSRSRTYTVSDEQRILKFAVHFYWVCMCDHGYSLRQRGNLRGGNAHCTCGCP